LLPLFLVLFYFLYYFLCSHFFPDTLIIFFVKIQYLAIKNVMKEDT
jgi:hypothetical protein